MPKTKPKLRTKRIVKIPANYMEAVDNGGSLFSPLYQFENGLRIMVNDFLTTCYGSNWWDFDLHKRLPKIHQYALDQKTKRASMPWIGASKAVTILPIHLVTLGQLEDIVKAYQSDCIPQLFPSLNFFLGHMEVVKRVRNLYSHMFPCVTKNDCRVARREITTLAQHINSRLH